MKNKSLGFRLGIVFLVFGVFLGVVNHVLLEIFNYTFQILISFPIFFALGLSLVLFPGATNLTDDKSQQLREFVKNSPKFHILMWIVFSFIGIAGTIAVLFFYELK